MQDICSCTDCATYFQLYGNQTKSLNSEWKTGVCKNGSFHQTFLQGKSSLLTSYKFQSLNTSSLMSSCEINAGKETNTLATECRESMHTSLLGDNTSHEHAENPLLYRRINRGSLKPQCTCEHGFSMSPSTWTLPCLSTPLRSEKKVKSIADIYYKATASFCSTPRESPLIYVSFVPKRTEHKREVLQFCKTLKENGFDVKCDNYNTLATAGELNIHNWRDLNFRKAKFVILCLSPEYTRCILNVENEMPTASVEEDKDEKGAVYIFSLARAEIIDNSSLNRRFIPVIFTNSKERGRKIEVPSCFKPFSQFFYPKEQDLIFDCMNSASKEMAL